MSAPDLARAIAVFRPEMPVVLNSGYSSVIADEGVQSFLMVHKPYTIATLAVALKTSPARWG